MGTYKPLTRKITDKDGKQIITCGYFGTEECRIHKANGCTECPILAIMIGQLYQFEQSYMEEDEDKDGST